METLKLAKELIEQKLNGLITLKTLETRLKKNNTPLKHYIAGKACITVVLTINNKIKTLKF